MKILNFLTNKAGKLVIGAPQVLTIAGVGLVATYGAFKTDQVLDNDLPLRNLSSVASSNAYEGLNRGADGMLTSMNIQNRAGANGVAVGADRERLEGTRSKNDFGLTAIDNLGNTVSIPGAGTAAATSATDGLGSGGVDMVELNGAPSSRASVPGGNVYAAAQGASGAQPGGRAAGGRLASASMARASGSGLNATSGPIGGSSSGASGRRGGSGSRGSGSEGYQFSGSMPTGSNIVSSYTNASGGRMGNSQFLAGGRNASFGRGGRRVNEANDLKKISKMSADVAKDRNRGVVGGARPFLANTSTTGGMSIDSATESTGASSADFSTPTSRKLKAIGDWGKQEEQKSNDRSNARTRLLWMTLALIAAAIAAIPVVYRIISLAKKKGVFAAGGIGLGVALAGAVMAYAAVVMGFAVSYFAKYNGNKFLPTLSLMMGGAAIVSMALTIKNALKNTGKNMSMEELKAKGSFYSKALGFAGKAGTTAAVTTGQQAVQKLQQDK